MHIIVSLSCRLGHGNWCTWVKYILTTTNLLHIWEEQYFDNNYLLVLKERLFHNNISATDTRKYSKLRNVSKTTYL